MHLGEVLRDNHINRFLFCLMVVMSCYEILMHKQFSWEKTTVPNPRHPIPHTTSIKLVILLV